MIPTDDESTPGGNGVAARLTGPGWSRRRILHASALGALATAFPIAGGLARAQDATPAAARTTGSSFPVEIQLRMLESVNRRLAETETPGVLIGVWHPEWGSWLHAGGISNLLTAAPATVDDHVRIASNTKTFTATVVLQLVDEGAIALDDPLEQYIPGVPNGAEITIRQVLGMTSGIADFVAVPELAAEYVIDPMMDFGPEQILEVIRNSTPDFAPGERLQYSNSNYILLGLLIREVTGRDPSVEITDRLIEPVGLSNTSFPLTAWMPEPTMHGYFAEELGDPLIDVTRSNPDFPWTTGAMISTISDLRTWAVALADGSLLTPESQRARLGVRTIGGPFGLGYGLGVLSANGFLGHNGGIPGYSSWMLHNPDTNASIVIVANRAGEQGGTADPFLVDLLALLFPEQFPELIPLAASATPVP